MALTTQQESFIGVFGKIPHVVNRFFTRRIKKGKIPFITNMKTINFEELESFSKKAKILQRGAEFPLVKLNGSKIQSVTPEVIKTAFPFEPEDQLNREPGQPLFINGQRVDNRTYERDRRIAGIKQAIETVAEEISAGVFLKGKYKSVDTKNEVAYIYPAATSVARTSIEEWSIWFTKQVNEFSKDKKMQVTEILVGENVFNDILKTYNASSNKVIPANARRVTTEDGQWELHLEVFGFDFVMIPYVTDTEGNQIDMSDSIMFYNELAFLPTYAGLINVVGGRSSMEAIDVLIRETSADEKTGLAETLGESAYCPIVVNPTLIKQIKVTGL